MAYNFYNKVPDPLYDILTFDRTHNAVGLNNTTPTTNLDVNGTLQTGTCQTNTLNTFTLNTSSLSANISLHHSNGLTIFPFGINYDYVKGKPNPFYPYNTFDKVNASNITSIYQMTDSTNKVIVSPTSHLIKPSAFGNTPAYLTRDQFNNYKALIDKNLENTKNHFITGIILLLAVGIPLKGLDKALASPVFRNFLFNIFPRYATALVKDLTRALL
jgi:hypothetical protein